MFSHASAIASAQSATHAWCAYISQQELRGIDLFDSVRAAPPDPTGEAVAVRGDKLTWECGEHPALGQRRNDMSQTLCIHNVCDREVQTIRCMHQLWRVLC